LNLAVVVGGTLSGYLGERIGWRAGLIVIGVSGLVLALVESGIAGGCIQLAKEQDGDRNIRRDVAAIVRIPTYWVIVGENILASIVSECFQLNATELTGNFGMGLIAAGFGGTVLFQLAA
jgi:predicted MFS family arabinose efflux permease